MPAPKGSIPWNKGKTKLQSPGLLKISEQRRQKNNFSNWYAENPVYYAKLEHSPDLAELYGTMLGDGCLEKFPRTEKLDIAFNSKEVEHIQHTIQLLERIFKKTPAIRKDKNANCVHVSFYQKNISKRLHFPLGKKSRHDLRIPLWIKAEKKYLISCLKGLFETDGAWVIDSKYNTNCMTYTSIHQNLLIDIQKALISLKFYARLTTKRVTLNRRAETTAFAKLISFRQYK